MVTTNTVPTRDRKNRISKVDKDVPTSRLDTANRENHPIPPNIHRQPLMLSDTAQVFL